MSARVRVLVRIKPDILDPEGEATKKSLKRQGLLSPQDVRIGKLIDITLESKQNLAEELEKIKKAAQKFLSNPVMEDIIVEVVDEAAHGS